MNEIVISEKIGYIEACDAPLSADVGIIRDNSAIWLYDVGNREDKISGLNGNYKVVLSHFHPDHTGNIGKIPYNDLYVSKETYRHVLAGTIVDKDIYVGGLHIFPIPSCHAKGCLGLEVDETYAFVGDALYCKVKNGRYVYNSQLLKDEIEVLKGLRAKFLLVSHFKGLIRDKEVVIAELESVYARRSKNSTDIILPVDF